MPHDLVADVSKQRIGLIRMDKDEKVPFENALAGKVGGSAHRLILEAPRMDMLDDLLPQSMFWICNLVDECRSDNPHHAVGTIQIEDGGESGYLFAVVYLSAEVHASYPLPKVLDHFSRTYGLRRLP